MCFSPPAALQRLVIYLVRRKKRREFIITELNEKRPVSTSVFFHAEWELCVQMTRLEVISAVVEDENVSFCLFNFNFYKIKNIQSRLMLADL